MNKTFSIKEQIRYGWNTFLRKKKFFLGISFLYVLISTIPSVIDSIQKNIPQSTEDPLFIVVLLVVDIALIILGFIVPIGYLYIMLRVVDNQDVVWKDLFTTQKVFWKFLFTGILSALLVFLGLIILIVPGIIASIALMFASYFVIDDKSGPIKSLKQSYRLTRGYWLKLFGFIIVLGICNVIGIALLGVGFLVSFPVSALASTHLYRELKHKQSEILERDTVRHDIQPSGDLTSVPSRV